MFQRVSGLPLKSEVFVIFGVLAKLEYLINRDSCGAVSKAQK